MMESPPPPPPHPILYLPGLPDYGFYSAPSDQRGGPCSFADYGSLGPQAAQMLHSEHATSACNSPLQHLHSPDQFKNPGLYMRICLIHILEFSVWFMTFIPCRWSNLIHFIYIFLFAFVKERKKILPPSKKNLWKRCLADKIALHVLPPFVSVLNVDFLFLCEVMFQPLLAHKGPIHTECNPPFACEQNNYWWCQRVHQPR